MKQNRLLQVAAGLLLLGLGHTARADEAQRIDPKAREVLSATAAYLKSADTLDLTAQTTAEEVSSTNEKIQLDSTMKLMIERPNKVHFEKSGYENFGVWYDGTNVSVLDKKANKYAKFPFQGNLFELGDKLDDLGIDAPMAGLFNETMDDHIKKNVTDAEIQGETTILDTLTTHVALRQNDVDWQLWVDKATSAPKKIAIVSKTVTGSPTYQILVRDLKVNKKIAADNFTFNPPAGAEEVSIKSFGELDDNQ